MDSFDRQMMELVVLTARKCKSDGTTPLVAAIAAKDGKYLGVAYRGQRDGKPGEHAEYILLEHELEGHDQVPGATIYTTLEPCTKRGEGKHPCIEWLISRRVARVVIGMVDPNLFISGKGCRMLREASITVEFFPSDLMAILEDLNRHFIQTIQNDPIHVALQEIGDLATHPRLKSVRGREAVAIALAQCAKELRTGQVIIPGKETGYFKRMLDCIRAATEPELVKAYIRLVSIDPCELQKKSWFKGFYEQIAEPVRIGMLKLEYVFLLRHEELTDHERVFIDGYKTVAQQIKLLYPNAHGISSDLLRPSIALLDTQKIAFTHDRGDDGMLAEAVEWVFPGDYLRLHDQLLKLQMASTLYFEK